MKKIRSWLVAIVVIGLISFGVYKVFFDCEHLYTHFEREFTLGIMDYATVDEEVIVKLMGIDDNRCLKEDCEHEGDMVAKVLVINNHRVSYVKLDNLVDTTKDLTKIGYMIELIEINDEKKVTLKLTKLEK